MKRTTLVQIICYLLSFLFLYTGVSKLLSLKQFASTLSHIDAIHAVAPLLSYVIVGMEIVVSVMLLFNATRYAGLILSFALMIFFTLFIASLMLFANHVPCTCGGVISSMSWGQHLVFNFIFIALSFIAIKSFMHETGEAENLQNRVGNFKTTKS